MNLLTVAVKQSRVVRWSCLTIDPDLHIVCAEDVIISTSRAECELLHLLITRRNVPMSKEAITAALFGAGHGRDPRQIDMFVARLRATLLRAGLPTVITTIAGRGYAVLDHDDLDAQFPYALPSGSDAPIFATA